jgi:hypothetical protein
MVGQPIVPQPFTTEDAAAWANVCYRLSLRCGKPVMEQILHLTMDVNWTDAINMWVWTRERGYALRCRHQWRDAPMRALNNSRAFGLTHTRAIYSEHLYKMLNHERKLTL